MTPHPHCCFKNPFLFFFPRMPTFKAHPSRLYPWELFFAIISINVSISLPFVITFIISVIILSEHNIHINIPSTPAFCLLDLVMICLLSPHWCQQCNPSQNSLLPSTHCFTPPHLQVLYPLLIPIFPDNYFSIITPRILSFNQLT